MAWNLARASAVTYCRISAVIQPAVTEVLGEKYYTVSVVDEWMNMDHWWNDTDRENWSTGRRILYSVGGRWMNEYGTLVEWPWQSSVEKLQEIPNPSYSTFDPERTGLGSNPDRPLTKSATVRSDRNRNIPQPCHCTHWATLPPPQTKPLHVTLIPNLFPIVNKTQGKADGLVFRRVFYKAVLVIMIRRNRWKYNINGINTVKCWRENFDNSHV